MELKPCPFCGGRAIIRIRHECVGHGDYVDAFTVACDVCGARGSKFDDYLSDPHAELKLQAIDAWNRRYNDTT